MTTPLLRLAVDHRRPNALCSKAGHCDIDNTLLNKKRIGKIALCPMERYCDTQLDENILNIDYLKPLIKCVLTSKQTISWNFEHLCWCSLKLP